MALAPSRSSSPQASAAPRQDPRPWAPRPGVGRSPGALPRRLPAALVADAHLPSAVAGLRGLGRAGIEVSALGPHWGAAGLWSRFARHRVIAPCPEKQRYRFVSETSDLLARTGPVVAYPASERSIDALVDVAHAVPERAQLPFPAGAAVDRLRDKRELAKLAGRLDLAVPTSWEGPAASLGAASFPLPALVKSRGPSGSPPPVRVVESPDDLRAAALELPREEAVLVQPYLRAPLLMLAVVLDREGRAVSRFAQVAERTWPRKAGTAAVIASVSPDQDLVDAAVELLARVGYFGLAQLDFLVTTDGPKLIDVNPRFYASLPLALACDVNLPAAWHAVATGTRPPVERLYPVGVTYRSLEANLASRLERVAGFLARYGKEPV